MTEFQFDRFLDLLAGGFLFRREARESPELERKGRVQWAAGFIANGLAFHLGAPPRGCAAVIVDAAAELIDELDRRYPEDKP